jgi:hypothetical protein
MYPFDGAARTMHSVGAHLPLLFIAHPDPQSAADTGHSCCCIAAVAEEEEQQQSRSLAEPCDVQSATGDEASYLQTTDVACFPGNVFEPPLPLKVVQRETSLDTEFTNINSAVEVTACCRLCLHVDVPMHTASQS